MSESSGPILFKQMQNEEKEEEKVPRVMKKSKSTTDAPSFSELEIPSSLAQNQKSSKSPEDAHIHELLQELKDCQYGDSGTVVKKVKNLYKFIDECKNKKLINKRKSEIIKVISLFVDTDSPEILIHIVQILLSLQVRKQNLATAYKLVFKIAREAENDQCFMNSNVLDLLINSIAMACPVSDSEALVYGYGALKFLTMNSMTREKLGKMGILDLVLLHLKLICEAKSERRVTDETSHVLFQLTGVIRKSFAILF